MTTCGRLVDIEAIEPTHLFEKGGQSETKPGGTGVGMILVVEDGRT